MGWQSITNVGKKLTNNIQLSIFVLSPIEYLFRLFFQIIERTETFEGFPYPYMVIKRIL
jgi:hypothetical protein